MDLLLFELHAWLARIGYRPYFSGMDIVADCPDLLARRLAATIGRAYGDTGRRVHLIGHSLGGVFARSAAVRMPERIASVVTLGTPFRGIVIHGFVLALADVTRTMIRTRYGNLPEQCATSQCGCAFGRSLRRQAEIGQAGSHLYARRRDRSLAPLPDWGSESKYSGPWDACRSYLQFNCVHAYCGTPG